MAVLYVHYEGATVGRLAEDPMGFTYEPAWLERDDVFPISHSIPLTDEPHFESARNYFGNLLPEGAVRTAVCRKLGISEENDFALLQQIGGDCAGAIVLSPDPTPPGVPPNRYRELTDAQMSTYAAAPSAYAAALSHEFRLSLAGAQDKLPVKREGNRIFLPIEGSPSTHLLKFSNRDYAALPENELLALRLGAAIGLPVVPAQRWPIEERNALLVARYDRVVSEAPTVRLHQEDLCQALGLPRHRKYEDEGGPSFADCYSFVREVSSNPLADTTELLRWLVFCVAVGNRDNHAKNLSIVRGQRGEWRLAPFYDLVTTTAYHAHTKNLAMRVGGLRDGGNLNRAAWHNQAAQLDIGGTFLLKIVQETVDAMEEALVPTHEELAEDLGRDAVLAAPKGAIGKGMRSVRRSVRR